MKSSTEVHRSAGKVARIARHFIDAGVITAADRPRFNGIVQARKLLNSVSVEVLVVALAYLAMITLIRVFLRAFLLLRFAISTSAAGGVAQRVLYTGTSFFSFIYVIYVIVAVVILSLVCSWGLCWCSAASWLTHGAGEYCITAG